MRKTRNAIAVLLLVLLATVAAQAAPCPLPGQAPMLVTRLYLGLSRPGGAVTDAEWNSFVATVVSPRFPGGFTIYDANGAWRDGKTNATRHEPSHVLEIAAPDTRASRENLAAIAAAYRRRFAQQSVGMVSQTLCAVF